MTLRACIYARYSSDLQSDASIEDQIRLCSEKIKTENWVMQQCYTDAAISGASIMRPGIQSLLDAALKGNFDVLVTEALDRLSRDQEDIAGIYKRMEFAGVKIFTLSEGEISTLHIGLKGTMNAMFLKDLADKTRRGLRGKVEQGKSGGGISYGYRVIKQFDSNGEAIRGEREIDSYEAGILKRIFHEYAIENKSPKFIASKLNDEGVACPSGKHWGQSTINGNRKRGTGILNNELYIGKLVWNRQRYIKDPMTGKRVTRLNPSSEWIEQDVPQLTIIPSELWTAAKERQKSLDRKPTAMWQTNRPQYLLSGLLKCGVCDGGYAKINATHYGCSTSKNKGKSVCSNTITIRRDKLESVVLGALQNRLMREELVTVFCLEYTKHLNTLHIKQNAFIAQQKSDLAASQKDRENLIQALKNGIDAALIKDDLEAVAAKIEALEKSLSKTQEIKPLIHPSMATRYSQTVMALRENLNTEGAIGEAADKLRQLISKIVLSPKKTKDELQIDLHGELAGIINISGERKGIFEEDFLDRIELLASNDNNPTLQDSVGCGSRI